MYLALFSWNQACVMVREFSTRSTAIRACDVYSSYIILPDLPTFIPFCVGAPQFSMNYNQELSLKQNEQSFCPELNEESPVSRSPAPSLSWLRLCIHFLQR